MATRDVVEIFSNLSADLDGQCRIDVGNDDGEYINWIIDSDDPLLLWKRLRTPLFDSKLPGQEFAPAMIVTATGDNGWDDYLLLYHYDSSEEIDPLPEIAT